MSAFLRQDLKFAIDGQSTVPFLQFGGKFIEGIQVGIIRPFVKTDDEYLVEGGVFFQRDVNFAQGDAHRARDWEAIGSGTDRRKGDRFYFVLLGESETTAVTARQSLVLSVVAILPDGTDRMDNPMRGQVVSSRYFCIASLATSEPAAFLQESGASCTMNGAVNPAAAQKRCVGSVHDRIDALRSDIPLDDFDSLGHKQLLYPILESPARPEHG